MPPKKIALICYNLTMSNNDIKKVFIGVAWPYVNGDIHVGHLAGYLIPCDIFARYSRIKGEEVLMVSGTDCHGTPITLEADKEGISPQDIINRHDPKVRELIEQYGITYDLFTTTTTENHAEVVQNVFLNLLKNGFILKNKSRQYYSQKEERFLPDRYVEGECPYCHSNDQRADQCENCGRTLGFGELIEPKSKLTKSEVTLEETEHYFLDLEKLQPQLKEYVEKSGNWRKWVLAETQKWLREGLHARAITRDIDWGVEIPVDKIPKEMLIDGVESKRFYVWFDAVIGYLSASVELSKKIKKPDYWKEFWINSDAKHYYFMGKDNLVFHTVIWPAQLIGQEKGYNLPSFPCVNQFLNLEGAKFSKSRGVHLDPKVIGEKYGVDYVRYYLTSIMPETSDSNWKWDEFYATINNELVANVGNFIHRVLSFYKSKFIDMGVDISDDFQVDSNVESQINEAFTLVRKHLDKCSFTTALDRILLLSKYGNKYLDEKKPWQEYKISTSNALESIYNCLQIINSLRILLYPFIPNSMITLSNTLGLGHIEIDLGKDYYVYKQIDLHELDIKEIRPLFQKIEEKE